MAYFIRTEENKIDINNSLLRGKSIDGWVRIGKGAWYHLYYSPFKIVKEIMLKVLNQKVEFLPISQNDRQKAYLHLINISHIKHICSKEEYIESLSDDVIYRSIHPIYIEIRRNITKNSSYKEKEIAQLLDLEQCNNGYIKYLKGLCALEMFDKIPKIKDCTKKLLGDNKKPYLLKYLVCFEGEEVGEDTGDDWGEPWKLFKPSKILWVEESGFKGERNICI